MPARVPDPSLRALLRGRRPTPAAMRPPWALAEPEFLESCTRCGDCVRACPQRVLGLGDGGFPVLLARAGECTFCRACVDACAPAALRADRDRAWNWVVEVDARCLTHSGIVCQSCRDACAPRAIRFQPSRAVAQPQIDGDRCNACGACVAVCPAAAIAFRPLAAVRT